MSYVEFISRLPNVHESDAQNVARDAQARAKETEALAQDQSFVGTFGLSVGNFAAAWVGAGVDFSESVRPGVGAEGAITVYAVAGPILAVPLPVNLPSLTLGISLPPETSQGGGISAVDCAPLLMIATPVLSIQVTPTSFNLSAGVAIQLGAAVGILCGFAAH